MSPYLRRVAFALAAVASITALSAQEKFAPVVASEWTATDGAPTIAEKAKTILLPAGAQLSRVFATAQIDLRVVSRPVFSSIPADWASLELGPASLTFVRDANGGGMVLLGDEPLALPFGLPLDEKGRCVNPLDLVLSYDQAEGKATLTIQKVAFDVEATSPAGSVEVAVSAGRSTPWLLDTLEVKLPKTAGAAAGGGGGGAAQTAKSISNELRGIERRDALAQARALFAKDDDAAGEKALTDHNSNPRNTAEWHLESANELIQAAFSLTRAGQPKKAAQLAKRALEHTEKAARKAARQPGQAALAATAEQTSAFIQERLLADYAGAKSFYQSAALRQPTGPAAAELRRLGRIEREARRKSGEAVSDEEVPDVIVVPPSQADDNASSEAAEGSAS